MSARATAELIAKSVSGQLCVDLVRPQNHNLDGKEWKGGWGNFPGGAEAVKGCSHP